MITSAGRPVTHKDLLLKLLDEIQLPAKVTVCKCVTHTNNTDSVSRGNRLADEAAKKSSLRVCVCLCTD